MLQSHGLILVVEDDDTEREALARVLRLEGYDVRTAANLAEALACGELPVDLVLSDLKLSRHSGVDLLRQWQKLHRPVPFIILTAFGTIETAVDAIKLGADDFLAKPVDPLQLLARIAELLARSRARQGDDAPAPDRIIGDSPAIQRVHDQIRRSASSSSTVLILGESGTGKELVARAIHQASGRLGPLVVVNMAAVPDSLVESELFGHARGAFTSAVANRTGRFEQAHQGTLFIDEVGDTPRQVQPKLLRVVEDRMVAPVGADQPIKVDVRIIAATSQPLAQLVRDGTFREDLYYRLNVLAIDVPPLRQRREDIPLLTDHFLSIWGQESGRRGPSVTYPLMAKLCQLEWPGNVRQLKNCLERMCVMASGDSLDLADLPADLLGNDPSPVGDRLDSLERSAIINALRRFGGNRTHAAELLGISVRTLQRRLREWGLAEAPE